MTVTCAAGCTVRGRHREDCADPDTCAGCLPALAADGLEVCARDETNVRKALRELPGMWADLGDTRRGIGYGGTGGGGDEAPEPMPAERAGARDAIRACLVSWCLILAEPVAEGGRDVGLPADTVRAMAHHVALHAGWLLASPHAALLVSDLFRDYAVRPALSDEVPRVEGCASRARRILGRSGRRGVTVPCPSCGERVRLDPDVEEIACPCGEWGDLTWWREKAAPQVDGLMPAADLVAWLLLNHRARVTEADLRKWAHRGRITRQGRDEKGRSLYDPLEVAVHVIGARVESA